MRRSILSIIALGTITIAGCGSTTTTSGTTATLFTASTPSVPTPDALPSARTHRHHKTRRATPTVTAAQATVAFRATLSNHYSEAVALGDGRGCVKVKREQFACTAHMNDPARNIDLIGAVDARSGSPIVTFRPQRGHEITDWFLKSGGGCKTNAC